MNLSICMIGFVLLAVILWYGIKADKNIDKKENKLIRICITLTSIIISIAAILFCFGMTILIFTYAAVLVLFGICIFCFSKVFIKKK